MSMGHNGGPDFAAFDEVVRENLSRGLLLTIKETFIQLMRDNRLEHRHRRVFTEIVAAMNNREASAYPGYKRLAEQSGYSEGGIRKTISELTTLGYLVSVRRQPSTGGRAMAHYAIRKPTVAEIESEINKYVLMARNLKPRQKPKFWEADVTQRGNVTRTGNVTHVGNIKRDSDVTRMGNNTDSDVTPVPPTVTSSKISSSITKRESVSSTVFKKQPSVAKTQTTIDWTMLNPHNVAAAAECAWVKNRLEVAGEFRAELLAEVGGDEIKLRAVLDAVASYGGKETATGLTLQRYVRSKFSQAQRWFEIDQAKLNRGKPASVKHETPESRVAAMLETMGGKQMVREMGYEKAKEAIAKNLGAKS